MAFIGPISAENHYYFKEKVSLHIAKRDIGCGDLIITERALMWRPDGQADGFGISIPWTSVSLHAITGEPLRSIYLQLDFCLKWPGVYEGSWPADGVIEANGNGVQGDEDDEGNVSDSSDDMASTELNLIPQDVNDINQIYYTMNHCQEMNPDPEDSISDVEEDEDEFMDGDGNGSDDAQDDMQNLHLNDDSNQFAD